jgi:predicted acylesterase/phospholipase RssA
MRGLTFSSGGAHGAWEVSVLKQLMKNNYDMYAGISAGALNAAFVSQYSSLETATIALEKLWSSVNNSKIYKQWNLLGPVNGLWKTSLYNSQPLWDLIDENIKLPAVRSSGKRVVVGAVKMQTGALKTFDGWGAHFLDGVKASSAFPVFFCPVNIGGELYVDGGVKDCHLIKPLIDAGCTEIDIISTQPVETVRVSGCKNVVDVLKGVMGMMSDEVSENDIKLCQAYNDLTEFVIGDKKKIAIRVFRPEKQLSDNALDFDPAKIKRLLAGG